MGELLHSKAVSLHDVSSRILCWIPVCTLLSFVGSTTGPYNRPLTESVLVACSLSCALTLVRAHYLGGGESGCCLSLA